ncbi:MAG: TIGR02281 family clan AA aspartic protease [Nitratireductor sp.]
MKSGQFAGLVYLGVWGTLVGAAILPGRGQFREFARNAVIWVAIILALMTGYVYRYELQDVASRMTAGLIPGSPLSATNSQGRQTSTLYAGADGHFVANAEVEGKKLTFLVDTGASAVVLSHDDAQALGIDTARLAYTSPVATANGMTTAARIRLGNITIGGISRNDVPAMVAQQGAMDGSLLGMTFLSTLSSFEFRGDRLILTE